MGGQLGGCNEWYYGKREEGKECGNICECTGPGCTVKGKNDASVELANFDALSGCADAPYVLTFRRPNRNSPESQIRSSQGNNGDRFLVDISILTPWYNSSLLWSTPTSLSYPPIELRNLKHPPAGQKSWDGVNSQQQQKRQYQRLQSHLS